MKNLPYVYDDGGRKDAGRKGHTRDCVARAITIASGKPYAEVYEALAAGTGNQRATSRTGKRTRTASKGINTSRKWFKDYMHTLGFRWTPTMGIGTGCTVHLLEGELPSGRLVVAVSGHYTAVIDGVIRDTHNPSRSVMHYRESDGKIWISHRCVYGYWTFNQTGEGL